MTFLVVIIALALIFDYINGFHDAANSIATIVSTKVLTPFQAVMWAAVFNFAAFFISKYLIGGFGIANTIAKSVTIQQADPLALYVILAGLLSAIAWNLITWWFGIPSSSSHALIGAMAGAGLAKGGLAAITWGTKWNQTLSAIVLSPLLGGLVAMILMFVVMWLF